MSPSLADLAPSLLALVGLSLLMVFAMVQWSRALLNRRPAESIEPGMSPVLRWGMTYALTWAALIAFSLYFLPQAGRTDQRSNLVLMLLAAAGWIAFNLLLVAFARAIRKANERDGFAAGTRAEKKRYADENWTGANVGVKPAPTVPGLRERLRRALLVARNVVLALLVIGIGEALPPLQRLHAWVTAHDRALLSVIVPLGAVGYIVFMGCAIHLALAGNRPKGAAGGVQGEESASFAEVKAAWRARAWQVSSRWRRMFLMMFASALLAVGILGSIFVLAPAGIKLLLGIVSVYAAVQIAAGFARA